MAGWHEFYLMLGSSAAVLLGLMFVVVSISPETVASAPPGRVRAFITPTVVLFTLVFFVSALALVPHMPNALLALLFAAAIALSLRAVAAGLPLLALAVLLLLVVGIRNGWDLAIYLAQRRR